MGPTNGASRKFEGDFVKSKLRILAQEKNEKCFLLCRRRIRVEIDEDKDLDSTSSQRSDILIIGEKFLMPNLVIENTFTQSDQESTSGEEDIIGKTN